MDDSTPEKKELPAPLRRLNDALWNNSEDDVSHEECREGLPQLVADETAGVNAADKYARIQRHLDHCAECGEEYAMLLDLALAEMRGELNLEPSAPATARGEPRRPLSELQNRVLEWTRGLVRKLAPQGLAGLDATAAVFFAGMEPRRASEARAIYATEGTAGEADAARTLLAMSYATTQAFCQEFTVQQFDGLLQSDALAKTLEGLAEVTASGLGMDERRTHEFGKMYAEQVMFKPEELRGLLAENVG